MSDISNILSSTGISLEKVAADAFGAAVEDFTRGTLGIPGAPAVPSAAARRSDLSTWYASSYASALSGGTSYRPKLKFLFKVEFKFKAGVLDTLGSLITPSMRSSLEKNEFTFMIKTVDRPKVDFEYEDDVNQYNFRTKVLKKIRHRELTVTFMDDTGNRVFDFFRILMMIYSPITRRQMARDNSTIAPSSSTALMGNGMAFTSPDIDYNNIAHRAVVNTDIGQALEVIRVKQMFIDPSGTQAATGEVIFDFLNPRLVSFDLDDLSHETSDPNLLTMQFDYDWMEMVKINALQQPDTPVYDITVPGVTRAPVDVSVIPSGGSAAGGTIGTAVGNILSRQAARAAQQVTLNGIERAFTKTFGTGRFATDIGGRLAGTVGGAVSGIVGNASRSLLSGIGTSPNTTFSRALSSVLGDSTTAGRDVAQSYQTSSGAYSTFNPGAVNSVDGL